MATPNAPPLDVSVLNFLVKVMINDTLRNRLIEFAEKHRIRTKGTLSQVLVLTRNVAKKTPPFDSQEFLTPQGGQVAGLSRAAVQSILEQYGIKRVLSEEGGRTSRGAISRMTAYLALLNELHDAGLLDLQDIESWWVDQVRFFFAAKPLVIKMNPAWSLRNILAELFKTAEERQKQMPGTMVVGAVMQHLVGAKLELTLPDVEIIHHNFSTADAPSARKGDYLVSDTAIHVTTTPSEALIRKCRRNLDDNLRPMIVTTEKGVAAVDIFANNADITDQIDILTIDQFIIANIYEWCRFEQANRSHTLKELIDAYNRIVEKCETDPSLKIAIGWQ